MAVRLHMKVGFVAEQDRLADSPDTVVSEEPTIGATVRSKGNLYMVATSRVAGPRFREATALAAETVRQEYYYDESAGTVVCLQKAIRAANKKLLHQRERLVGTDAGGPIGLAVAVVRGSELYVVTVGPAQAFLIRQARLATLPDPNREAGLPTNDLIPDVWRGDIAVGDSLILASSNLASRLGPEELTSAMVTLLPQPAVEHLHHRFVAADGTGSDGAIAFEATEVPATSLVHRLIPAQAHEPLAGVPDKSPIPLADSVSDGVAAVQGSARRAQSAAGVVAVRLLGRVQDSLPARAAPKDRRVTTLSARRQTQRRAAVAVLALIIIAASLGLGVWYLGGRGSSPGELGSISVGQHALQAAKADLDAVYAPGVNLVTDDPNRARQLLADAWKQLADAGKNGVPAAAIDPLRVRVRGGLDALYKMVPVSATVQFSFADVKPAVDLGAVVLGPDGAPYALDRTSGSVYRIDLKGGKATPIVKAGQSVGGSNIDVPKFIARAGPDVLILDAKNVLLRWRPADNAGKGTLKRVQVKDSASWGTDIRAIGAFVRDPTQGLYNLYVVDPSEKQIRAFSPAADGNGFPADSSPWLAAPQDVSNVDSMVIDGDIYLTRGGTITRFYKGGSTSWKPADPGDALLRTAPAYTEVTTPSDQNLGLVYGYDRANARVLAIQKDTGAILEQYQLADGNPGWSDMRGMYVVPGALGQPATLFWIDANRLMVSALIRAATPAQASPTPSPSASPSVSPKPAATPTKKPTKTPTPTRTP